MSQGKMLNEEFACVLTLHRDDLVQAGLPEELKDKIDNGTLEEIADKLSDALLDSAYWISLSTIISDMKLLERPEDDPDNSLTEEIQTKEATTIEDTKNFPETPIYLKCPQCGGSSFTEFATEETSQGGVRLTNTGDRDYEKAGEVIIVGDYIEVNGYRCQGCGAKYEFSEGILTKETL